MRRWSVTKLNTSDEDKLTDEERGYYVLSNVETFSS